ncbi:hypothetical protein SESBI_29689 [Sesbania bispinosa]|nr:hypothetical protein SESBI_29689 [Sesbania bispinosa]
MSKYPTLGSIYELFGFEVSALVLMDYDEGQSVRLLRLGNFSINLFMHITYPILAVFCSLAGFDRPLTKDTIVIRMGKRTFAIALPGLLYGLQFPSSFLEALVGYPMLDNEPNMWNRLRPQIESMAHEAIKKLGHFPGISRFHIPNLNSCLVRANRMSVTTKLIIESLSTGTLKSTQFKIIGSCKNKGVYQNKAYPSVNLFSRLVDAVEHAWVLSSGLGHMLRDDVEPLSECNHKFKVWCLNEEGIVDFLHRLEYVIEKDKKLIDKEKVEASAKANDKGKSITP